MTIEIIENALKEHEALITVIDSDGYCIEVMEWELIPIVSELIPIRGENPYIMVSYLGQTYWIRKTLYSIMT